MWYGRTLIANKKIDEGINYGKEDYVIRKKEFGAKNNLTLTTQSLHGQNLRIADKLVEQEKHLVESYNGLNEILGLEKDATQQILISLVELYNT